MVTAVTWQRWPQPKTPCCTQTASLYVLQNQSYHRLKFYIVGIGIFPPVTLTLTRWPSYTNLTHISWWCTRWAKMNYLCHGFRKLSSETYTTEIIYHATSQGVITRWPSTVNLLICMPLPEVYMVLLWPWPLTSKCYQFISVPTCTKIVNWFVRYWANTLSVHNHAWTDAKTKSPKTGSFSWLTANWSIKELTLGQLKLSKV